jgi:fatty acid CoA ligase FadD9
MLAHEHYSGQMNSEDMFTRLLYSLIQTGIAPLSFYKLSADGEVQNAHYDGVPVNIVSSVVAHAPVNQAGDPKVMNIMNYHMDDGCSLDAFVSWMIAAGHPIARIDSHAEWFSLFVQKLKALPPKPRSQSLLPISDAFSRPLPVDLPVPGHKNFKTLYRNISNGQDIPHLSDSFIQKFLADMKEKDLIH